MGSHRILSSLTASSTPSTSNNIDRIYASSKTIMDMIDEYQASSASLLPVEKVNDIIVESLEPIYNIPSIGVKNIIHFHDWWRKIIFNWITNARHQNLGWRHLRLMVEQTARQSQRDNSSKSDAENENNNKDSLQNKLLSWIVEQDLVFVGLSKSSSSLLFRLSDDDVDVATIDRDIKAVFDSLTNDY